MITHSPYYTVLPRAPWPTHWPTPSPKALQNGGYLCIKFPEDHLPLLLWVRLSSPTTWLRFLLLLERTCFIRFKPGGINKSEDVGWCFVFLRFRLFLGGMGCGGGRVWTTLTIGPGDNGGGIGSDLVALLSAFSACFFLLLISSIASVIKAALGFQICL